MKRLGLLLALSCLLTVHLPAFGHFFKVDTLSDGDQTIMLVSDYHCSSKPDSQKTNAQQRKELVAYAAAHDAAVIVEDSMIAGVDEIINSASVGVTPAFFTQKELQESPVDTPLDGLYSLCKISAVETTNVECRFTHQRMLPVYCEFFVNKKKQIRQEYLNDTQWHDYYVQTLEHLEKNVEQPLAQLFNSFKTFDGRLRNYLESNANRYSQEVDTVYSTLFPEEDASLSYKEKLNIVLSFYGATFLDMDAIHALQTYKEKDTVIICAGFYHIDALKKLLLNAGYSCQKTVGNDVVIQEDGTYQEPESLPISLALDSLRDTYSFIWSIRWILSFIIMIVANL